jgi:hypothetical protein
VKATIDQVQHPDKCKEHAIMTDAPRLAAIAQTLAPLRSMLQADGYELAVTGSDEQPHLTLFATDGACAECLVPKSMVAAMAVSMLADAGVTLELDESAVTFPGDIRG